MCLNVLHHKLELTNISISKSYGKIILVKHSQQHLAHRKHYSLSDKSENSINITKATTRIHLEIITYYFFKAFPSHTSLWKVFNPKEEVK